MSENSINHTEVQRRLLVYFLAINFFSIVSGIIAVYLVDLLAGAIVFAVAMLVMIYIVFKLEK